MKTEEAGEVYDQPSLETANWSVYWDPEQADWYFYNKLSGKLYSLHCTYVCPATIKLPTPSNPPLSLPSFLAFPAFPLLQKNPLPGLCYTLFHFAYLPSLNNLIIRILHLDQASRVEAHLAGLSEEEERPGERTYRLWPEAEQDS